MNNFFSIFNKKLAELIRIEKNLAKKLMLCADIFKNVGISKKKKRYFIQKDIK